ncbi:hypothetical protein FJZ40_03845, partial [Candidatus Shapirobacteria bacterium]|nr:hypothetical protein [Candidatus Shapirobacteria bacterium]
MINKLKKEKILGLVEGFFSRPLPIWTFSERIDIIDFISKRSKRINYYLYCPKQDPYVVDYWDKQYPPKILKNLQKTVEFASCRGIRLAFGFNPQLPNSLSADEYQKLISQISQKIDQLIKIGIRDFAVLFDDIPALDDLDQNLDIVNKRIISETLVKIVNEVYATYRNSMDSFLACFYDYYFKKPSVLTETIKYRLNPGIKIIWTGGDRFVKRATAKKFLKLKRVLGKKEIIYWSNYPSNNCEHALGVFHLDPFSAPETRVYKNLGGLLINPMREAYANLPVLKTFADFLKRPNNYNGNRSLTAFYKEFFGKNSNLIYFIYKEFSYPNITKRKKFLWKLALASKREIVFSIKELAFAIFSLNSLSAKNLSQEAKNFLLVTKPLIKEAQIFSKLLSKIINNKKVNFAEFSRGDEFPTITNTPRYLGEIRKIVSKRLAMVA